MTPQEIIDRIIDLGLNEDAPDTDMADKALSWLNMAYAEIYGISVKLGYPLRMTTQSIAASSTGLATLEVSLRNILSVYDSTDNRMLKKSDVIAVENDDPSLAKTGSPTRFYVDNIDQANVITDIRVHPNSAVSLRVRGIEPFEALLADGEEKDIQLPVEFHELLIWAGLLMGTVYERGFGNDSTIAFANSRKNQLLENLELYLADTLSHEPRRAKVQDF